MNTRLPYLLGALLSLLSLGACSTPERKPVEIGALLKGRAVKLRAHADDRAPSELGFLELKFRTCNNAGRYARCVVDFACDSAQGRGTALVSGNEDNITVNFRALEHLRYRFDAEVNLQWDGQRWQGKGKVGGEFFPAAARVPASRNKPFAFLEHLDF